MNIVYIDAGGVCADSYMYRYYGDLVREMKQIVKVHHCEDFLSNPDITNLVSKIPEKVDLIIFGLGYFAQNNPAAFQKFRGLSEVQIPVFGLLHKPQNMLSEKLNFCKINNFDLLIV